MSTMEGFHWLLQKRCFQEEFVCCRMLEVQQLLVGKQLDLVALLPIPNTQLPH